MKFTSESPDKKYSVFSYNNLSIYLDKNDLFTETVEEATAFCNKYGYCSDHNKASAVYYLRGRLEQADYGQVLKGVLLAETLPPELNEITHCLTFWNQEGVKCYNMNKKGDESYTDFILGVIASDCQVFVNPYCDQFITGKGGNHVWVNHRGTNQRILIIHF